MCISHRLRLRIIYYFDIPMSICKDLRYELWEPYHATEIESNGGKIE